MYHPTSPEELIIFNESRTKVGSGGMGDVYRVQRSSSVITEKFKHLGKIRLLSKYHIPANTNHPSLTPCDIQYQSLRKFDIRPCHSPKPISLEIPIHPGTKQFFSNLQRFWYEVYCMKEITLAQRMEVPGAQYFNPIHEHTYGFDCNGNLFGIIRAPLIQNEHHEVQSCASFARKFQPHLMAHIALQTLTALNVTRDLEIILRDLKPEHILIDGDQIKIIDLGLARTMRGKVTFDSLFIPSYPNPKKSPELIHHSKLILPKGVQDFMTDFPDEITLGGTIHYMPISALKGHINQEVDTWAWLVSMYETASGVYPFPKIIEMCNQAGASIEMQMLTASLVLSKIDQNELEIQFRQANPLVPASFYHPLCAALKNPSPTNLTTFTNLLQDLANERTPDVTIAPTTTSSSSDTSTMSIIDVTKLVRLHN